MKELPVIQPGAPSAPTPQDQLETAALVRDPERTAALEPQVVGVLKQVFDPEIPVNIYDLGLIYDVLVDAQGVVGIRMTLTAPGCPVAQSLPVEVRQKVAAIPGVADAKVDVVWDPPWDRDKMSDAAKLQLGLW